MLKTILLIIYTLMTAFGVVMVYDARIITKKFFGFGDQNDASLGLKILGFFIIISGALMFYFQVK